MAISLRDFEPVLRSVWEQPLLRGMPAGTVFSYEFVPGAGPPGLVAALLTPPGCATCRAVSVPGRDLTAAELADLFDAELLALRDAHWLATFNAWPGWRL